MQFLSLPAELWAVTLVVLVTSWFVISCLRGRGKRIPPGPPSWPLIGTIPSFVRSKLGPLDLMSYLADKYGDIFRIRVMTTDIIVLNDYRLIRDAFNHPDLQARPRITPIEDFYGRKNVGLAGSSGKVWRDHRQFVHSAMRALSSGSRTIDDVVHGEAVTLIAEVTKTNGLCFNPHRVLNSAVSNVISVLLYGLAYDYDNPDFIRLQEIINSNLQHAASGGILLFVPILARVPFSPAVKFKQGLQRFNDFSRRIVDAHRTILDPHNPKDIIDMYLIKMHDTKNTTDSSFDETNLFVLIGDLFGASTETTNASLKWAILYMIIYPDVQRRVQQELDSIVGRERLPALSDRSMLPFTEATLHEIQRMGPAAPLGIAHACSADTSFAGYDVSEGTLIVSNLWRLARDSRIWSEPDTFNPDRFLTDDGECIKPDELIPFSTGKRVCTGESLARKELFVFFTSLLHQFTFELPDGQPLPNMEGRLGLIYNTQDFETCACKRD